MGGVGRLGQKHCSWNGLSGSMGGVGRLGRSLVLERSITAYGRCRRLGQKHGIGMVYHGLRTVLET